MIEILNTIIVSLSQAVEANGSILLAAFIGATISVVAREERSVWSSLASFLSGVFAGVYLTKVAITYVGLPPEPVAAVLAIMGRDLVRHIMMIGKENPLALLNFVAKLKTGGTVETDTKEK